MKINNKIRSETLRKRKEKLLNEIKVLEEVSKDFEEVNEYRLKTNTAYLLNSNIFKNWEGFKEFIETKHKQHWEGKNKSIIEVIFRLKSK